MKTLKATKALAALAAALVYSAAGAESRIWTDTTGKTIEAEQVKLLNEQVVLRLTNGKEIRVSLDSLSAADREAAMLNEPPTLDLKVSAKTSRSNTSLRSVGPGSQVQVQEESTQVSVTVKKASSALYDLPLNTVLYLIGEGSGGQLQILDKVSETFTYSDNNRVFEFKSDALETAKAEGDERRTEYKGWLVTVLDPNGEIIAMKSSDREYTEKAETLIASNETSIRDRLEEALQPKSGRAMANFFRFDF
ncbi:SHD1 domain-containing protein [Pontiellaceae bacterium B12219]|nr:SHD1 domain-containing protein [Pontiellaceae bacterium B12219]